MRRRPVDERQEGREPRIERVVRCAPRPQLLQAQHHRDGLAWERDSGERLVDGARRVRLVGRLARAAGELDVGRGQAVLEELEEVAQREVWGWVLGRGLEEERRRRVLGGEPRILQYAQAERGRDEREGRAPASGHLTVLGRPPVPGPPHEQNFRPRSL